MHVVVALMYGTKYEGDLSRNDESRELRFLFEEFGISLSDDCWYHSHHLNPHPSKQRIVLISL